MKTKMKTKSVKRIGAVILAVTMLLGVNFTAVLAAADDTGRNPDRPVSLTIYKYETNDDTFTGVENNGLEQTIPATANPISNVIFQIELVTLKSSADPVSTSPDDYVAVTGENAFSTTGTTNDDGMVYFTSDDRNADPDAIAIPGQGIYKVTEISGPGSVTFIASLPMTNPSDGGEWLYDVFAYPKNDLGLSIDKEYIGQASDGNILKWQISVPIPSDIGSSTNVGGASLAITDNLDYRLTYISNSIAGIYTDKTGASDNLLYNTDYTLSKTASTDSSSKAIEVLTITFTETGLKKLAAAMETEGNSTAAIIFNFDTRDDMGLSDNLGTIENPAVLDYTNASGYVYDPVNDKDDTKLYGIKIHKINVNNENLSGAKFKIYTDAACTKPLLKQDGTGDWEVTTVDGYAYIYGLTEGTYYLVETEAPAGYNPLSAPITVVISADAEEGTVSAENTVQVTVTNNKGFELPRTGGIGEILFTVGGLVLIAMAVVLIVYAKRKKTKSV